MQVEKILNSLENDRHRQPKKLVIMSFSPVVAFKVFLWVRKRGYRTAFFHSIQLFLERKALVDSFEERKSENEDSV